MKKYLIFLIAIVAALPVTAQKRNLKTEIIKVSGECVQCKDRIEQAVKELKVFNGKWDVNTKMLTVQYDSTKLSREAIEKKVAAVGHDTENFTAPDDVYKNLPDCCLYERNLNPGYEQKEQAQRINQDSVTTQLDFVEGYIFTQDAEGNLKPLDNTTVYSKQTAKSVVTDAEGKFHIHGHTAGEITISHVGYKDENIELKAGTGIEITLRKNTNTHLQEVVVTAKTFSSFVSTRSTFNTLSIGIKELKKAACCNLSESFETTPSVDVSYADAVTGIKQIQLLGLAGPYTQITTENTPEIRGLPSIYGLTFIPGPWISDIQLTKGVGSVVNGYESIAGQINVEEVKPEKAPKLFVNGYANEQGRLETSINLAQRINDKWSTGLLTHVNGVAREIDHNGDGFIDLPVGRQYNFISRWQYGDEKGLFSQFAFKYLNDDRRSGDINFNPGSDKFTSNAYGVGVKAKQYGFSGKLGYVYPGKNYKSIGLIFSANKYDNDSYYGLTSYRSKQDAVYANLIYQSILGSEKHKYKLGAGINNDFIQEKVATRQFQRTESVPGVFAEYTFSPNLKFTTIAGIRADFHNHYGTIFTPRLHLKYDLTPSTNLRLSAGSGWRTANVFAENAGYFVSARSWDFVNANTGYAYGFGREKAWNYGLNLVQKFKIADRQGSVGFDAYRTVFGNQVVADLDASPRKVLFYDLDGKSYSNTLQAEVNYELIKKLDLKMAYRWLDVQTTYSGKQLQKPLVSRHRAFLNLAYETGNHWKFDYTTQWLSRKRIPNTATNPAGFQLADFSPSFVQMTAQVTKQLAGKWDLYLGAENLTNYMQENPILASDQPFGQYFDASMVWGPITGRMIYAGFRFTLK